METWLIYGILFLLAYCADRLRGIEKILKAKDGPSLPRAEGGPK